jgi:DNA invertase Pin-like site-specific DNA recombinase
MLVGYARTWAIEQAAGLVAQKRDLKSARCGKQFTEHASSVAQQLAELDRVLEFVRDGDTLVVTRWTGWPA